MSQQISSCVEFLFHAVLVWFKGLATIFIKQAANDYSRPDLHFAQEAGYIR